MDRDTTQNQPLKMSAFMKKKNGVGIWNKVQMITLLENLKLCPNIQFSEKFKIAKSNFWAKIKMIFEKVLKMPGLPW